MVHRSELPFLIRLLDDDSPVVRDNVQRELAAYGASLRAAIESLPLHLTPVQQAYVDRFLSHWRRERLRAEWSSWLRIDDDKERLEAALGLIAGFLDETNGGDQLREMLDRLAEKFTKHACAVDARELAAFLFQKERFRGAKADFYSPQNSNLVSVIERREGIPISLTCVYLLVGHRVGIPLEGCNFPGHFLALARDGDRRVLIDCYNGGTLVAHTDLRSTESWLAIGIDDVTSLACDSTGIVARVLRNLIHAFRMAHSRLHTASRPREESHLDVQLLKDLLQTLSRDLSP
jgi:hypothetical protein